MFIPTFHICSILANQICAIKFISEIMNNKYSYTPQRYPHLTPKEPTSYQLYERQSFNRLILQLNSQNEFLSKNMKQLIVENVSLKNKLYHTRENNKAKQEEGRAEVKVHTKRVEWAKELRDGESKLQKIERSIPKYKKVQDAGNEIKYERRNSPWDSQFKKPTIIEGLSESHFRGAAFTPKSKNIESKRGIYLSKDVEKMTRSQENPKRSELKQLRQDQAIESSQQIAKIEKKEQDGFSETQKIIIHKESPSAESKINPENERGPKEEHTPSKHKKDNRPYLIIPNSFTKTQGNGFQPDKKIFNNKVYLNMGK